MKTCSRIQTLMVATLAVLFATQSWADVDLTGVWVKRTHEDWQEAGDGPDLGDYLGLPINDEARTRALSYTGSSLALPERQCLFYAPNYLIQGFFGVEFTAETDPLTSAVIAWHIGPVLDRGALTIWMDGRPAPSPNAPRPVGGFTRGEWIGNTLKTVTTNFRQGYVRRNGAPSSDKGVFTMHFTRHGDVLTLLGIVEDPVYLTEPYVRSQSFVLNPEAVPTNGSSAACVPAAEVASLDGSGAVPHVPPEENQTPMQFARTYGLPLSAVLGGAETMYPEYRLKLKESYQRPESCTRYCCGWEIVGRAALPLGCEITATPRPIKRSQQKPILK